MTARLAALQGLHWPFTASGLHVFSQVFPVLVIQLLLLLLGHMCPGSL